MRKQSPPDLVYERDSMANNLGDAGVIHGLHGSYALLEVIGRGAYGTVYKGIWCEVGRHVAIKRVARSRLSSEEEERALQAEIELFKNLKDRHIVKYIEAVDDPSSPYLDIVMEYVEGGSLFSIVQSIRRSRPTGAHIFDERVVAGFIRQVVCGLRYLHRQGVVHRDIKGANILVTKMSHVKLADFGVASTRPSYDLSTSNNPIDVAGSPYWMAPEIIELTGSSTASDIWSLGCTVIELLTGFPPYHDLNVFSAMFSISRDQCPPLPPDLSVDCEDFLMKCFNKDMNARPSADDLLKHRWLAVDDELGTSAAAGDWAESSAVDDSKAAALDTEPDESGVADLETPSSNRDPGAAAINLKTYAEDEEETYDDFEFEENAIGISVGLVNQGIGVDNGVVGSPGADSSSGGMENRSYGGLEGFGSTSSEGALGKISNMNSVNLRDDPFHDLLDPEADLERERLRRQKELWDRVKVQTAALGGEEDAHVAACDALLQLFHEHPEQRYSLIYDPGLLPILEVLEKGGNGSSRVVEAILRVSLSLLEDPESSSPVQPAAAAADARSTRAESTMDMVSFGYPRVSDIREDLCLAGFLPAVMRYCDRAHSFEARLLAARFLERMLEVKWTLHMFIACRGFTVFVDMLEPDVMSAGDLPRIALVGIAKMLSMENQRHKRDFCRRFASCGLLDRIVHGITHCMTSLEQQFATDIDSSDAIAQHVTSLAQLLQTFAARADPKVKATMTTRDVLNPIVRQITNRFTPQDAVQSILCCVRDLSRDPQTHQALQDVAAIETLVQYLSVGGGGSDSRPRHYIISSLHNLCIVSPARQEAAAKAGLVPHLQRYIRSNDINLRSLCIDMYSGLACAGHLTRLELSKHKGVDFYVELLEMLSVPGTVRKWQARVLQSLSEWLDDTSEQSAVEDRLVLPQNRSRVCSSLAGMRVVDVEGVLEPYWRIVTGSQRLNVEFGQSDELVSAMVRWLERMYVSGNVSEPRGRLLLLRTLLAHARVWTRDKVSGHPGLVSALRLLLSETVMVTDEAITVREQASLLLSALDGG